MYAPLPHSRKPLADFQTPLWLVRAPSGGPECFPASGNVPPRLPQAPRTAHQARSVRSPTFCRSALMRSACQRASQAPSTTGPSTLRVVGCGTCPSPGGTLSWRYCATRCAVDAGRPMVRLHCRRQRSWEVAPGTGRCRRRRCRRRPRRRPSAFSARPNRSTGEVESCLGRCAVLGQCSSREGAPTTRQRAFRSP